MSKNENELNQNAGFLQSVIECYNLYGLEPAIVYLYTNSVDFEQELSAVLTEIYKNDNIEYKENEELNFHLKNIKNYIANSHNIFDLNRGYKGEWPVSDINKLKSNENEIIKCLANIIKLIKIDINQQTKVINHIKSK